MVLAAVPSGWHGSQLPNQLAITNEAMTDQPTIIVEETPDDQDDFEDTSWQMKRYYRGRTRVLAVVSATAFLLPLLYIFGVTIKEIVQPPPSPYAAPPEPPEGPAAPEELPAEAPE